MPRLHCVLAALLLTIATGQAGAQSPTPPPGSTPSAGVPTPGQDVSRFAAGPQAQWPKTLPDPAAPPAQVTGWSRAEVDLARSRCNALLAGLNTVHTIVEPIREGECGAPAAVELISVGRDPQVSLSTPAIVTCEMAASLDTFVKSEMQPAARELLGAPIVRLEVMSAYSCRNAYGRKKSRLSEHGRANALDIGAFVTQKGDTVAVLSEWGPTERDIKARIAAAAAAAKAAAAKAEAIKREAEKAQAAMPPSAQKGQASPPAVAATPSGPALRGAVIDGPSEPAGSAQGRAGTMLGLTPSRLGGPKADKSEKRDMDAAGTPRQRFLKRFHAAACRSFATILGPEANEAHRNHFHIDMAERASGSYCE